MEEIKKETFRSREQLVCDSDDMVRVVLDMTKWEYCGYIKRHIFAGRCLK